MHQRLRYGARNYFLILFRNSALRPRLRDKTASVWPERPSCFGIGHQVQNRAFSAATLTYNNNRDCHDGNVDNEMVLTNEDIEIIKKHTLACKEKKNWYGDPKTGYMVFTEYYHKERGSCCGNECRHCPYGHRNVPQFKRKMKFNSFFYK